MTNFPETRLLDLEPAGAHLTIWLNSKVNRNALSDILMAELSQVLQSVKNNADIRVVTLRGRHGIFCAGGDLKNFSALRDAGDAAAIAAMNRSIGDLFDLLQSLPQVVIIFVEGAAIAGGLGLMCCADITVVTTDAKFSLTETMIGIVPAQIAPIIVARTGLSTARKLMLTGARFTGKDTPNYGLSDYVVGSADDFDALEASLIKGILKCAPGANGITKDILMVAPYQDRETQKIYAAEKFAQALLSGEGREGIDSFFEKRRPSWSQK